MNMKKNETAEQEGKEKTTVFGWIEWNSFFVINKPLIFIRAIRVMLMQNMRIF